MGEKEQGARLAESGEGFAADDASEVDAPEAGSKKAAPPPKKGEQRVKHDTVKNSIQNIR